MNANVKTFAKTADVEHEFIHVTLDPIVFIISISKSFISCDYLAIHKY